MNVGRRVLALGAAGALGLSGAIASAMPSQAQQLSGTAAVRIAADAPAPLPRGAVKLGALAPSSRLHLDVTLNVGDPAVLSAFLAGLSDQSSPLFHQFLRPGQFGPRFGLSLSSLAAVRAALLAAGLSPGAASSDRLSIPVDASAAAIEHAFGISLVRYRLPGGRVAFTNTAAPRIPAAAAPYVSGVLGLDNLYPQQTMLARPSAVPAGLSQGSAGHAVPQVDAAGPQPCTAARNAGASTGSYTANRLAAYYGMAPLYGMDDLGQGVRVALFELEPNLQSDVSAYKSCYKIKTKVTYTKVDGGSGSGAGSGEAALDIDGVLGLAPDIASLDIYQGPNGTDAQTYDTYKAIIKADKDKVISTSWGSCDLYTSPTFAEQEEVLFQEANTQGQTIFAAAGDSGSTGCFREGGPDESKLSAGNPASDPYVVGVGGTTITKSGQTVWNESKKQGGAGTGGLSAIWCMPAYQHKTAIPGLISSHSKTNSACPSAQGKYVREEPDVSADADPYSGYVIFHGGSWQGGWGGTSAAAPLWAAVAALIDDSPFCADYHSGSAGVLPAGLYAMASNDHSYIYPSGSFVPEGLSDVRKGNNDYTPDGYGGGLYPATRGYDLATGLGTPLVTGLNSRSKPSNFYPGLAALMCQWYATRLKTDKVTGLSSHKGSRNGGQKITVVGSGFLPIAGADMAVIGSTLVPARCTSSTKCTVVLPKHKAGTVDIRISAEDFGASARTKADSYRYE